MGDTTAAGMGMRACEEDGRWKGVIAAAEDLLPKVEEKLEKMLVICMAVDGCIAWDLCQGNEVKKRERLGPTRAVIYKLPRASAK